MSAFSNGTIEVRSIGEIQEGAEVTYPYIDLYQVRRSRWDALKTRYHIEKCYCSESSLIPALALPLPFTLLVLLFQAAAPSPR